MEKSGTLWAKVLWKNSPRNAAIFGFSGMFCWMTFLPAMFFLTLPKMMANPFRLDVLIPIVGFWIFMFVLLIWLFGITGVAYIAMLRSALPQKWSNWVPEIGKLLAFFFPLGGAALIPGLIRQRRPVFALMGVISVLGGVVGLFGRFLPDGLVSPWLLWWGAWGCFAGFIVAATGYRDGRKFRGWSFIPFVLVLAYAVGIRVYNSHLDHELAEGRRLLSADVGQSVEEVDFWLREEKGVPLDAEPLKSLIAHAPKSVELAQSVADAARKLADFRRLNSAFVNAAEALVKLPPRAGRHLNPHDNLTAMAMPELTPLRNAARYLSLKLTANAANRAEVLKCNAELENLRDRCLANSALISKLVAVSIEAIRLDALAFPMAEETLSREDWENILKVRPDWAAAFVLAIGDEATAYQSIYHYITSGWFHGKKTEAGLPEFYAKTGRVLPLEMTIHFKRDYLFALDQYRKLPPLFLATETPGKPRFLAARVDERKIREHFYLLSGMLLPAMDSLLLRQIQIADTSRLPGIALEVMAYRQKQGRLPESLDFLPEKPLDSLTGQPICYEVGMLSIRSADGQTRRQYGFRLYWRDPDGRDPGGEKAKSVFTVPLPEQQKQ